MSQLIDVSHTSKRGSSLRITIPKKVQEKLDVKEEDIVGFYEEDGVDSWSPPYLIIQDLPFEALGILVGYYCIVNSIL